MNLDWLLSFGINPGVVVATAGKDQRMHLIPIYDGEMQIAVGRNS